MTITQSDLIDRELIRDVIYRYCKGIDRLDFDLLFDCFTEDATHQHGDYSGNNDFFKGLVSDVIANADGTLHTIGTILIDLKNDEAETESCFVAYHRFPGGPDGAAPIPTGGVDTDWVVAGRYIDQFVRTNSGWKISHRKAIHDWTRSDPAHPK